MNEENLYDVIFNGQIVSGESIDQVKENLARLFKANEATIEKLFSSKNIAIKKSITEQKANTYLQAMQNAGALAKLRLVENIELINLAPPPPINYYEEEEYAPPPPAEVTNAADPLGIKPASQWKLDALGSRMSKPKRVSKKPLPMTEHLDLAPPMSDVGQAKHSVEAVTPDISQLNMAETGAQLSDSTQKSPPPAPDVSHLDIAAVGENMGQATVDKELQNPDISQYELAETGSDMGQLQKEKELLDPDISHLELGPDNQVSD